MQFRKTQELVRIDYLCFYDMLVLNFHICCLGRRYASKYPQRSAIGFCCLNLSQCVYQFEKFIVTIALPCFLIRRLHLRCVVLQRVAILLSGGARLETVLTTLAYGRIA